MTYRTRIIKLGTCLGLLAVAMLAACRSEEPAPAAATPADNRFDIKFAIAIGSPIPTRSLDVETGTAPENVIDTKDLKILVFDKNGTLYDVIYDHGAVLPAHSELLAGPYLMPEGYYYFSVSLKPDYAREFALVVLANWEGVESDTRLTRHFSDLKVGVEGIGTLKIEQLKNALFTLNPDSGNPDAPTVSWTPGDGQWIPMFGSKYCTLEGYDSAIHNRYNPKSLGDINLVRAFAKIEVINNDTVPEAPTVTSVALAKRNIDGRLMQDFNFKSETGTGQVQDISVHTGSRFSDSDILFHQNGNTFTAYVPELALTGHDDRRKAIRVTIRHSDDEETTEDKWLWLAPYSKDTGRPLTDSSAYPDEWKDIRRNYIYRYTITSLGFDFEISCEAWKYGGKYHIDFEQVK